MEYWRLFLSAVVTAILDILKPFAPKESPRILVIKLDHLGDVITALPVFPVLREALPEAQIDVMAGPWARDILESQPAVDGFIAYASKRFDRAAGSRRGFRDRYRLMRAVAAYRYTHIVELRGDSWTMLLPFLGGTLNRVDRGTVRFEDWLERKMGDARAKAKPPKHEVQTNLEIIQPVVEDMVLPPDRVSIVVPEEERAAMTRKARADDLPEGVPIVTLHPGAAWRPRAWRPERFAEVAMEILDRYPGIHVCFVGSPKDADIADRISTIVRTPNAHFFFELPILETAALIQRSVLFIGNDSGIAHLAAACGTPLIALFGPQDPRRFRPWSDRAVVLHKPVTCFPCKQTKCAIPSNPCVNLIFIDEVLRQAEAVLGAPLEAPRPRPVPIRVPAAVTR